MATQLKKYNLAGEEIGTIALEDGWVESMVHPQMVKDAVVAYRAHQRQWSANTQTRRFFGFTMIVCTLMTRTLFLE